MTVLALSNRCLLVILTILTIRFQPGADEKAKVDLHDLCNLNTARCKQNTGDFAKAKVVS